MKDVNNIDTEIKEILEAAESEDEMPQIVFKGCKVKIVIEGKKLSGHIDKALDFD